MSYAAELLSGLRGTSTVDLVEIIGQPNHIDCELAHTVIKNFRTESYLEREPSDRSGPHNAELADGIRTVIAATTSCPSIYESKVKRAQAARREVLTTVSTATEEKQVYSGSTTIAEAAIPPHNLSWHRPRGIFQHTQVRSIVNGMLKTADACRRLCDSWIHEHLGGD